MNCSLLNLSPKDAVVGVFFHRLLHTISIVGSQLSRHRNSFLALRQRTRSKFTVFTFFLHLHYKTVFTFSLHLHYKIANAIGEIDSCARLLRVSIQLRVIDRTTDIVTAESKESHFMVNIAT